VAKIDLVNIPESKLLIHFQFKKFKFLPPLENMLGGGSTVLLKVNRMSKRITSNVEKKNLWQTIEEHIKKHAYIFPKKHERSLLALNLSDTVH
jgi:hypothetical protein